MSRRLKILSLSYVFPTPKEPQHGIFVRSRLAHMAKLADIRVCAPLPLVDYSNPRRDLFEAVSMPRHRTDQGMEVYHPLWLYPPGGGASNARILAWRLKPLLARIRREFPFQLIDAHFAHPSGVAAAILADRFECPFTVTLRGNEHTLSKRPPVRRLMEWSLAKAARVITVSERLRQLAIELGANPRTAITIPNGIDDTLFHPRDREAVRGAFGIPPGARVVLSAGTLCPRKGHHRVIQALRNIESYLVIAGGPTREGSNEKELQQVVSDLGMGKRVRFTGHITPPQLADWMSAADVFCLASSQEGWPNVVHEAMACGAPIVATDVGALPEMVPSADYGTVVPLPDAEALERALSAALDRQWDRTRIADWARARSWGQVAREVIQQMTAAADEAARK